MMRGQVFAAVTVLAIFAGCASVKELEVMAPLAPMPEPDIKPGYKEVALRNGVEVTTTLLSEAGTTRDWSLSNGCTATTPREGFGPALTWNNCNGSTGTQTVTPKGTIWPLAVGKEWSYAYAGSNVRGDKWSGTRSCTVKTTVRIPSSLGEQDTFKVVCGDHWSSYVYYVSPAQKTTLRYEQINRDNTRITSELLRVE